MFRLYIFSIIFILIAGLASCEKQTETKTDFATLQMYGWTPDFSSVVVNFKDEPLVKYSEATKLNSQSFGQFMNKFYVSQENQPISFYAFPDTFPTSKPVLKVNLQLEKRQVYSMFLSGTTSHLDTVLVKDRFPDINPADSLAWLRFVNLVNHDPISVNLKDEPIGSVVENLPYMSTTDFQMFSAKRDRETFEFEFRDVATEELLFTYIVDDISGELNKSHQWYSKILTFAFIGQPGGVGANQQAIKILQHN